VYIGVYSWFNFLYRAKKNAGRWHSRRFQMVFYVFSRLLSTWPDSWQWLKSGFVFCWRQTAPRTYSSIFSSFTPQKHCSYSPPMTEAIGLLSVLYRLSGPVSRKTVWTKRNFFLINRLQKKQGEHFFLFFVTIPTAFF
jgi:hypothetical protein